MDPPGGGFPCLFDPSRVELSKVRGLRAQLLEKGEDRLEDEACALGAELFDAEARRALPS